MMQGAEERTGLTNTGQSTAMDAANSADSWLTPGRFAAVLGMLVFAMFPAVLLGKETFVLRDFAVFSYPVAHFQRECFWRGELPLWNPYNYCGIPFLAQWNTMVLYPPTLIYLLLPLTWSLPFFCLVHVFWGGLGMCLLAHRWTGNRLASGLAGVFFSFNGLPMNFLMWPSHIATFSWIPWVLWLVPDGWRAGGRRLVWAVVAGSMQMLAGGPETILFTWMILLLLVIGEWLQTSRAAEKLIGDGTPIGPQGSRWPARKSLPLLRFFCIAVLVALVCAAQLLPFLQLIANSDRDAGTRAAGFDWSMPLWGWANFLVPLFRTVPSTQGVFFQVEQNWTSSYYGGIGLVFFAGIAFWRVRSWRVKLLGLLVLASLVLALGDAGVLYRGLRYCAPMIGIVRYPVKFTILILAILPLLAAIGMRWLLLESNIKKGPIWIWAAALLLFVGFSVFIDGKSSIPRDAWHSTLANGVIRAAFFAGLLALTAGLSILKGFPRLLCAGLLLVVCWLDLATHVPNQNPTVPPGVYSAGWARAQLGWGRQLDLGQGRVMLTPESDEALRYHSLPVLEEDLLVKRLAFFANCNLLDNVPQAYGFFSLTPSGIANLANLPYVHTNMPVTSLLDFMAVSRTPSPGTVHNWTERPTTMPLITTGQRPVFADENTTLAGLLQTNADLRRIVFLPPSARAGISATNQFEARVLQSRFEPGRVTAQVEASGPSLVVISQSCYPAWRAYVDGRATTIQKANYAFQALEIPGGQHQIELRYEDKAFKIGAVLSAIGSVLCAALWHKNSRKNSCPMPDGLRPG